MKNLFTSILILVSICLFAQNKVEQGSGLTPKWETISDTTYIKVNEIQLEKLNAIQLKINAAQKQLEESNKEFESALEILLGVRKDDIDQLIFDPKKNLFKLTKKKK